MRICPECGTRNEAGAEFCSSCHTFLAWDDPGSPPQPPPPGRERAPNPPPEPGPRPRPDPAPGPRPGPRPAPEPTPRPAPGPSPGPRPMGSTGSSRAMGTTGTRHNPEKVRRLSAQPADQDPTDDRTVPLPRWPGPAPGAGHGQARLRPPDGTERTGSTVHGPGAVPPSKTFEETPPVDDHRPPASPPRTQRRRAPAPGETPCPRCGTGNPPDRHFCRRCALELGGAGREVRVEPPPPPRPRGLSPAVRALLVLVVLAVAVLVVLGQLPG